MPEDLENRIIQTNDGLALLALPPSLGLNCGLRRIAMPDASPESLIDIIYGAVSEPDLWHSVMESTADAVHGSSAWLSHLSMLDGTGGGLITRIDPAMPALYASHYALRNPLSNVVDPETYLRAWTPRILTDEDWMAKEDLLASEYFNDFLKPQDIYSTVMIRLAKRGSEVATLNINRSQKHPQFGQADLKMLAALHPHLIRAFRLTEMFIGLENTANGVLSVFSRLAQPYILLDANGRILHANPSAESYLVDDGRIAVRGNVLSAKSPRDAARLSHAIALASKTRGAMASSIELYSETNASVMLDVVPVTSTRSELLGAHGRVAICITDFAVRSRVSSARLVAAYDLTSAEARVAIALFEGAAVAEIARRFSVSISTIRSQLAATFEKTKTRNQADLIRLLGQIGIKPVAR